MNYPKIKKYIEITYPEKIRELIDYLDSLEFEKDVKKILQDQYKVNEPLSEEFAATCCIDRRADEISDF